MVWMYHLGSAAKILLYNPEHDFWWTETTSAKRGVIGKGKEHEAERMRFGWEKIQMGGRFVVELSWRRMELGSERSAENETGERKG